MGTHYNHITVILFSLSNNSINRMTDLYNHTVNDKGTFREFVFHVITELLDTVFNRLNNLVFISFSKILPAFLSKNISDHCCCILRKLFQHM